MSSDDKGQMSAIQPHVLHAVTSHAADYMQAWCVIDSVSCDTELNAAQALLAAGRGPARLPSCECALQHVRLTRKIAYREERICRPLVLRALSLFGPDELRKLEVADPGILDILAFLTKVRPVPALDSLRAVVWSDTVMRRFHGFQPVVDFINRHATNLATLDCPLPFVFPAADHALARCRQLESLAHASCFMPAAWLGLRQLHTLRGVDLHVVPAAAIAAALPRLHTLAFQTTTASANAVRGLFEDLLPRLRVLEFRGRWPHAAGIVEPRPLPRLQELVWRCGSSKDVVTRAFAGAQPVKLHVPCDVVVDWLSGQEADVNFCCGATGGGPLALVQDLTVGLTSVTSADLIRLLRAAPELRKFCVWLVSPHLLWTAADPEYADSEYASLVHHRLRCLAFAGDARNATFPPDCAARLRRLYFPRLRQVTVEGCDHFVTLQE
jgi:hypothetical protein